ncbi:SsgA family sporulation/cell division regulator [Streptomyces sp. NPDC086554]|uniref:SsgA family sporulation/cell division regulator n=1 Tax=Streptomyces sp. NPDC086554 TaxID=3154864 RepID=UPI003431809A
MLLQGEGERKLVLARLHYSALRPFEMTVTFRLAGKAPVTWVFARDLLLDGRRYFAGQGDVRIWPMRQYTGDRVYLSLASDVGECLLSASVHEVDAWCGRMAALVPRGAEHLHFDLDREIRLLLQ